MLQGHEVIAALTKGTLPVGSTIKGTVVLPDDLSYLPENLNIEGSLILKNDLGLTALPKGLRVSRTLDLSGCKKLAGLPDDLQIGKALILEGCTALISLPPLRVPRSICCRNCTRLSKVQNLVTHYLDLSGCVALRTLPKSLWVGGLNLSGCINIKALPDGLRVRSLSLENTQVSDLPDSLQGVRLTWRGVAVDADVVFNPELVTVQAILAEQNAERRQVLLNRYGFERFMNAAQAEVLHEDVDKGGERKLLRVRMKGDEDLLCLQVHCPSTRALYMLRVPPSMRTCHQSAAWLAGFDNPKDYQPSIET